MEEVENTGSRILAQNYANDTSIDAEIDSLRQELGLSSSEVDELAKEDIPEPTPEQLEQKGAEDFTKLDEDLKTTLPKGMTLGTRIDFAAGAFKGTIKGAEDLGNLAIEGFNAVDNWFEARGGKAADLSDNVGNLAFAPAAGTAISEQIGYAAGRYFSPLMGWMKGVGAVTKLGKAGKASAAVMGSAITSAAAVDPDDKNIAALMESIPELEGIVPDFMAIKPDDTIGQKRFKTGLEAVFVDATLLGTGKVLGAVLEMRKTQKTYAAAKKVAEAGEQIAAKVEAKAANEVPTEAGAVPPAVKEFTPDEQKTLDSAAKYFEEPNLVKVQELAGKENAIDFMQNLGLEDSPLYGQAYEEMRRGTRTIEQIGAEASKIAKDPAAMKELIGRKPGVAVNAEELTALAMHAQAEYQTMQQLIPDAGKAFNNNGERSAFMNQLARFRKMYEKMYTGSSEMGRGLRSFQESWKATKTSAARLELMDEYVRLSGKDADDVARYMQMARKAGVTGNELGKAIATKGRVQKISDIVYEHFYNGAVSGPATHAINALTNAANTVVHPLTTLIASGLSRTEGVYAREALATVQGYWAAQSEAMSTAMQVVFKNKIPEGMAQKIPELRETSIKMDGDGLTARVVNAYGRMINVPNALLSGSDAYFRLVNYRGRMHQMAMRKVLDQGLEVGSKEFNKTYQKLLKSPPQDIKLAADKFSKAQTFTTPMGELSGGEALEGLQTFMQKVPFGRAFTPFIRISANINEAVLNMLPGAQYLSSKINADFLAGGAAKHEAIAKMTVGASLLGSGAYLASTGKVTGSGPKDFASRKALEDRKEGWMPNSYLFADGSRVDLSRFQPFSSLLLMGADAAELMTHLREDSVAQIDDLIKGGLAIFADRATPSFLTEGMPKFFDTLHDIESGKLSVDEALQSMAKFIATAAPGSGFFKATTKRAFDPLKHDTTPESDGLMGMWEKVKNEWMDSVGLGKDLPIQRNIFGDPVVIPAAMGPDFLSPFYTTSQETDPLRDELQRLGLHGPLYNPKQPLGQEHLRISMPPRTVKMGSSGQIHAVDLSPKDYEKYVLYSAGIGLEDTPTLREALTEVLQDEDVALSDENRKYAIKKVVSAYRAMARAKIIGQSTDIQQRFMEAAAYTEYERLGRDEDQLKENLGGITDSLQDVGE